MRLKEQEELGTEIFRKDREAEERYFEHLIESHLSTIGRYAIIITKIMYYCERAWI